MPKLPRFLPSESGEFGFYFAIMDSDWAAQHLQTIRTLMERAAIYRRALAPIMIFTGCVGMLAALAGLYFHYDTPRGFIEYWLSVSLAPLAGAYLMVRRQALKDREPFWSPPTRRVTQALLPPLSAGLAVTVLLLRFLEKLRPEFAVAAGLGLLPLAWIILYGCALHAAGFFMPRGMKLFGWVFILSGCLLAGVGVPEKVAHPVYAHFVMGLFFGFLHAAYGVYLSLTEKRKNAE